MSSESPRCTPISVVLVDDEPELRLLLRSVLQRHDRLRVVGEAGDGLEALETVASTTPDLLVLDLQMPRLDGFGVLTRLSDRDAAPVTVVLSGHPDLGEEEQRLVASGAAACLSKSSALPELPARLLDIFEAASAG